jgi:hypothetical protein
MRIKEIFEIISDNFEISKEVLYQGFINDNYFRKFIKSKLNLNIDTELLCKEISEKHYLFMINFFRKNNN